MLGAIIGDIAYLDADLRAIYDQWVAFTEGKIHLVISE